MVFKKELGELPNRPKDDHVVKRGLDDKMWKLLCQCWSESPNDRPSIGDFVKEAEAFPVQSLLATLKKVYTPGTLFATTNRC